MSCSALVIMDPTSIRNSHREIAGRPLIDRVIGSLSEVVEAIYIVGLDNPCTLGKMELLPGNLWGGHVQALRAGLMHATTDWVFAVGGNWPFLSTGLIRHMLSRCAGAEAVLVRTDRGLETLHALYHRDCLPLLGKAVEFGLTDLNVLAGQLKSKIVDVVNSPNPMDRLSATEIRDEEDFAKAMRLADRLLEYEIAREVPAGR